MNDLKEIVIVGSGIRHLDSNIINRYISDNYVTIGPMYDYLKCKLYDYYFWTCNSFKVHVLMKDLAILPPKIKSILCECYPGLINRFNIYFPGGLERFKCEIYDDYPWLKVKVKSCSTGLRIFHYLISEYPNIKKIIFLGCSALYGSVPNTELVGHIHDFKQENLNIKTTAKEKEIQIDWAHTDGVY